MTHHRTATTARRPETRCHHCGNVVVEIDMLIDDAPLTMLACSTCDTRSWHRQGAPTTLTTVLADLSQVKTRYRRDLATAP